MDFLPYLIALAVVAGLGLSRRIAQRRRGRLADEERTTTMTVGSRSSSLLLAEMISHVYGYRPSASLVSSFSRNLAAEMQREE